MISKKIISKYVYYKSLAKTTGLLHFCIIGGGGGGVWERLKII